MFTTFLFRTCFFGVKSCEHVCLSEFIEASHASSQSKYLNFGCMNVESAVGRGYIQNIRNGEIPENAQLGTS